MLIPVRCFTCGKVIADGKYKVYCHRVAVGDEPKTVLDDLGLRKYCCRRMYTSHYDAVARHDRYDLGFPDDELEREEKRRRSKRLREKEEDDSPDRPALSRSKRNDE